MTEKRGLLGGISLVIGGLPLALFYGFQPLGYVGMTLIGIGVIVSYGAYIA